MHDNINLLVTKLTLKEKIALLSGNGFWTTKAINRLELPALTLSDGPFGLRKEYVDKKDGLLKTKQATAFPTSSALASSFNVDLLKEIGSAIGDECIDQEVDVILGPGVNIKRSPLGGRNFEYFSEDPYLSGTLAASMINGIQARGISACLKHFAVNSQEQKRLVVNEIVDKRALFETYLEAFRIVIKSVNVDSVMTSYNKINGVYGSENDYLINTVLRNKWKYKGLVMSDWGATNDPIKSLKAGLNLIMPGLVNNYKLYVKALKNGQISDEEINQAVKPILRLMVNKQRKVRTLGKRRTRLYERNFELSVKAATESAVLLKNEGNILPIKVTNNILLAGQFGRYPRFQGSGSSKINPTKTISLFTVLSTNGVVYRYSEGYSLDSDLVDEKRISDAVEKSQGKNVVIVSIGLPDSYEMEGMDRQHLNLPDSHNKLIDEIAKVNENIVVILNTGAPVLMPWIDKVKAVLLMHLPGGGGGNAAYDLLYGVVSPNGKLAETYPMSLEQTPTYYYYSNGAYNVHHRESIYVGYKFYDKIIQKPLFPFGFGLSYSKFDIFNLELSSTSLDVNKTITVSVNIKNVGKVSASEVIQLYISPIKPMIFMANKSLKGFAKVNLKPGEESRVIFKVSQTDFRFFDQRIEKFVVENGSYNLMIGNSSTHIMLTKKVIVNSDYVSTYRNYNLQAPMYYELEKQKLPIEITYKNFVGLNENVDYTKTKKRLGKLTMNSTLNDARTRILGRLVIKYAIKSIEKTNESRMIKDLMIGSLLDTPFRAFPTFTQNRFTLSKTNLILNLINKNFAKVFYYLFKK